MLTKIEKAVLDMMLDRPGEKFEIIRRQLALAQIKARTLSGVGFCTEFIIPPNTAVKRDLPNMEIGGVGAELPDLKHGAGFVLFVRDGVITMLEGFTYDEPWPTSNDGFKLFKAM